MLLGLRSGQGDHPKQDRILDIQFVSPHRTPYLLGLGVGPVDLAFGTHGDGAGPVVGGIDGGTARGQEDGEPSDEQSQESVGGAGIIPPKP
jgi:hypothetical protein